MTAVVSPVSVTRRLHPQGAAGAKVSLQAVADRIRKDYTDELVVAFARRVISEAGGPRGVPAKAQALLDALHKRAKYILDPTNSEYIASARHILCLDSNNKDLCHAGGDCFPEGTLLLRNDFEFVKIEDVNVGDMIWGYDKWTRVEAKKYKGLLNVDRIHSNNGSHMRLTGDHSVFVVTCEKHKHLKASCSCSTEECSIEKKRVSDLRKKDRLLQPKRIAFGTQTMDPDVALIEGFYVADGWSESNRFAISGQDGSPKEEQKRIVKSICERLGVATYWGRKYIRINDAKWTHRTQQMGLHAPQKHFLTINLEERAAAASLRGVMADSGTNAGGVGRTFTTTSWQLFLQTRILQRMFGSSCGQSYIVNHGGLGENPIWRLSVREAKIKCEKRLRVKEIDRRVEEVPCWDIQTDDHYVYLPEHDITVSNCDELTATYSSMAMAVGIDCVIVGQAFGGAKVPSHVLLAVFDPQTERWLKVDPSTNLPVGKAYPATSEVEIDPLTGVVPDFDGPAPQASFVGVGEIAARPLRRRFILGDTQASQATALGQSILPDLLASFTNAYFELNAAYAELVGTRKNLGVDIHDPEDPSIVNLATLPNQPVFTSMVDTLTVSLLQTMVPMMTFLIDANAGARQIYFDPRVQDFLISAKTSDPWKLLTFPGTSTVKTILGFFTNTPATTALPSLDSSGQVVSPATAAAALAASPLATTPTAQQISAIQTNANSSIAGLPRRFGVGAVPVVVTVALVVVGAIVISIAGYYAIQALSASLKTYLREVTNQDLIKCVASGKCPPAMMNALQQTRQIELQTDVEMQKNDPFAASLKSGASIVGSLVFAAIAIGGIVLAKSIVDRWPERKRVSA